MVVLTTAIRMCLAVVFFFGLTKSSKIIWYLILGEDTAVKTFLALCVFVVSTHCKVSITKPFLVRIYC